MKFEVDEVVYHRFHKKYYKIIRLVTDYPTHYHQFDVDDGSKYGLETGPAYCDKISKLEKALL